MVISRPVLTDNMELGIRGSLPLQDYLELGRFGTFPYGIFGIGQAAACPYGIFKISSPAFGQPLPPRRMILPVPDL
jgi:hypothetical protein